MAKPRELRRRIKSVQSTRKITKTMELVATSKLKRAQDRVIAARPYAAALAEVIADLYTPELAERFPLLRQPDPGRKPGGRVALILITANRGLCGAFNANLIREARRRIAQLEAEGGRGREPTSSGPRPGRFSSSCCRCMCATRCTGHSWRRRRRSGGRNAPP